MSEQQDLVAREIATSHEPLTEERLGDLLAGFGNHEGQAMLLQAMRPDIGYGQADLYGLLTDRLAGKKIGAVRRTNPMIWCRGSLSDIGAVVKDQTSDIIRYGLTPVGLEAQPLAAIALHISDKHNVSLTHLWGVTQSAGERRAPLSRYKMMKALLDTQTGMAPQEIADKTELGGIQIQLHLESLARNDLLTYDSWEFDRDSVYYELRLKDHEFSKPPAKPQAIWTRLATDYLKAHDKATLDELTDIAWKGMPATQRKQLTRQAMRARLNVSLNGFHDRGVLNRQGRKPPKVSLNEEQRELWRDVIGLVDSYRVQQPQFLADMRAVGKQLLNNPRRVEDALWRAYEASARGTTANRKEMGQLALQALEQDRKLSARHIADILAPQRGGSVSVWGVRTVLRRLVDEGVATEFSSDDGQLKLYRRA